MSRKLVDLILSDGHAQDHVLNAELREYWGLEAQLKVIEHLVKIASLTICVIEFEFDQNSLLFPVILFLWFLIIHSIFV